MKRINNRDRDRREITLRISRKTLLQLAAPQLEAVQGGYVNKFCTYRVSGCVG